MVPGLSTRLFGAVYSVFNTVEFPNQIDPNCQGEGNFYTDIYVMANNPLPVPITINEVGKAEAEVSWEARFV